MNGFFSRKLDFSGKTCIAIIVLVLGGALLMFNSRMNSIATAADIQQYADGLSPESVIRYKSKLEGIIRNSNHPLRVWQVREAHNLALDDQISKIEIQKSSLASLSK